MNLSNVTELAPLADVVRDVLRAAASAGTRAFIAGAFGRDLWLQFAHGIDAGRATSDLDFAIQCESWEKFHELSAALIETGLRRPGPRAPHRFIHQNGTPIDIIPFGGLERADRSIAWPPDGSHEMNLLGFSEALQATSTFELPGGVSVQVASLPLLAALKLLAWKNRGLAEPGKDATDLHAILRSYADAGNQERLLGELEALTERENFDYELAGSELLGRDLSRLVPAGLRDLLVELLERESDFAGDLRLSRDMKRYDLEGARKLLEACLDGMRAPDRPRGQSRN